MHQVINYFLNQPASTWTTLLSFLGASTAVATLLQILKHKLNFADAQKLIVFVLGVFSTVAASADYLISNASTSPLPTILGNGSKLMALAVIVHRFAVSPAYDKVVNGLGSLIKDANTYRESVKPLPTTPGETPVAGSTFEV